MPTPDTNVTTLFSLATVKAYLEIKGTDSGKDAVLIRLANSVSARIESMTNRVFVTRSIVDTFDPATRQPSYAMRATAYPFAFGPASVRLLNYPIASVTLVRRRPTLLDPWETLASTEYEVDGTRGILHLKQLGLYTGPRAAEITYVAGFDVKDGAGLPDALVGAALDYVKFCYLRNAAGMIFAGSATVGGNSIATVPNPPKDITDTILYFKKIRT